MFDVVRSLIYDPNWKLNLSFYVGVDTFWDFLGCPIDLGQQETFGSKIAVKTFKVHRNGRIIIIILSYADKCNTRSNVQFVLKAKEKTLRTRRSTEQKNSHHARDFGFFRRWCSVYVFSAWQLPVTIGWKEQKHEETRRWKKKKNETVT